MSRRQQRIALAHELGHALLHSEYDLYGVLDDATRDKIEIDADTFAHLLLNKGVKHGKETRN